MLILPQSKCTDAVPSSGAGGSHYNQNRCLSPAAPSPAILSPAKQPIFHWHPNKIPENGLGLRDLWWERGRVSVSHSIRIVRGLLGAGLKRTRNKLQHLPLPSQCWQSQVAFPIPACSHCVPAQRHGHTKLQGQPGHPEQRLAGNGTFYRSVISPHLIDEGSLICVRSSRVLVAAGGSRALPGQDAPGKGACGRGQRFYRHCNLIYSLF